MFTKKINFLSTGIILIALLLTACGPTEPEAATIPVVANTVTVEAPATVAPFVPVVEKFPVSPVRWTVMSECRHYDPLEPNKCIGDWVTIKLEMDVPFEMTVTIDGVAQQVTQRGNYTASVSYNYLEDQGTPDVIVTASNCEVQLPPIPGFGIHSVVPGYYNYECR